MEKMTEFKNIAMDSLVSMWLEVTKIFPNIIGTVLLLIIGFFVTKIILKIIRKILRLSNVEKLDHKLNDIEIVEGKSLNINTVAIITGFIKWIFYIMLLIMAADIMNLTIISEQISELLSYLPQLFSALVIFTLGLLFANFVKKSLRSLFDSMDTSGGKVISSVVFFLLLTFISITALNQAGVNTEIITSNLVMIMGAFLLAFALAFGFGAREIVGKLLKTFYIRKSFEVGQKIEFDNTVYTVKNIRNISIVLENEDGQLIVPIEEITQSRIKLK